MPRPLGTTGRMRLIQLVVYVVVVVVAVAPQNGSMELYFVFCHCRRCTQTDSKSPAQPPNVAANKFQMLSHKLWVFICTYGYNDMLPQNGFLMPRVLLQIKFDCTLLIGLQCGYKVAINKSIQRQRSQPVRHLGWPSPLTVNYGHAKQIT